MTQPILQANAIYKSFERPILKQISIEFAKQEIHVIMGRSGAGKSTLLKLLAGLIKTDKGSVSFEGRRLPNPEEVLVPGHEELAYVAQDFQLLKNRTVSENLKDALIAFKNEYAAEQINYLLNLMQLSSLSEKRIEKLSGGEKQRLAIARALATHPTVLLLDEPFTQLDFPTRQILLDSIKMIKSELQTAIILVSHNLYEGFYLADQVHILSDGQLIRSDSPTNIYHQPIYDRVAEIFGLVNRFPADILQLHDADFYGVWPQHMQLIQIAQRQYDFEFSMFLKEKTFLGSHYSYQLVLNDVIDCTCYHPKDLGVLNEDIQVGFNLQHVFPLKA